MSDTRTERPPLRIYKGNLSPSVVDRIYVDGAPYDLTSKSVRFQMRELEGTALKVDKAAVPDPDQVTNRGVVRYDWTDLDTDTPGSYAFWWRITVAGGVDQDSGEHRLDVLEHAPGEELRTGAIAKHLRYLLPATFDAMKGSERFGDEGIQLHIDLVKRRMLGTVVPAATEAGNYGIEVLDHIARITAVRIIPPAIDFWQDHSTTITTTGTDETQTFLDRREGLWRIRDQLLGQLARRELQLVDGQWIVALRSPSGGPRVSHERMDPSTPDPRDFPALDFEGYRATLPWSIS